MRRGTLIVFAREPVAGAVKTRLGRGIGMVAAAWWYRHQTARLLRRLARDRRWRTVLAIAPDRAVVSRAWPHWLRRRPQGPGDVGTRMARALAAAAPGPVVLIGTDIPDVAAADIAQAFALLGRNDVVLGPAADGGFWLIGLARPRPLPAGLFRGVRWSTADAMADTRAGLAGLRVGFARTLADVDEAADLAGKGGRKTASRFGHMVTH